MKQFKPLKFGKNDVTQKTKKELINSAIKSPPAGNNKDASEPKLPQANEHAELAATVPLIADESLFSTLVDISLNLIDSNEAPVRRLLSPKPLEQLAASIAKNNVIDPIVGRKQGERVKIVDGHGRIAASRSIGRKTVPVLLIKEDVSIQDERKIPLLGNSNRENLKPPELARALNNLLEASRPDLDLDGRIKLFNTFEKKSIPSKQDLATVAVARNVIGKRSLSTVRNLLNLLRLPRGVMQAIDNDEISFSKGSLLASHLDHPDFNEICNRAILEKDMTRDQLKKILQSPGQTQEDLKSLRFENLKQTIDVLAKEVRRHVDHITREQAAALCAKLDEILRTIDASRRKMTRQD